MPLLKIEYDRHIDKLSYEYAGVGVTECIRFAQLVQQLLLEDLFRDSETIGEDPRLERRNICWITIDYDKHSRKFNYDFYGMSYIEAIGILVIVQDMMSKELR